VLRHGETFLIFAITKIIIVVVAAIVEPVSLKSLIY
jgi:hypothetical protein